MSGNATPTWPLVRRLFSPMAVLLYVYAVYFLVGLSSIYEYAYWELMNFGLRMIGFQPTTTTVLLYVYGAVVLIFGFLVGCVIAERAGGRTSADGSSLDQRLRSIGDRLEALPVVRKLGTGYTLALAGWLFAFGANALQLFLGRASLFDIASRWAQSPVLVFLAALNIMFVPALFIFARSRGQRVLSALLFALTVVALGLLGARHLPAKLLISSFLAIVFVAKPKNVVKVGVAFFLMLALAMGVIGSISKSGIYGPTATAKLALALTYADSAGTTYNLDRIVRMTPPTGVFKGVLLKDSALSLIPGSDEEYANYQIGRYLGGREYFEIGGERIERSVSLAPTLLGAPYADWGVPGVVGQMLFFGVIFGYMQTRARRALWVVPPFVILASYIINGVNAGAHNPNTIAFLALAVGACIIDVFLARRAPSLYLPIDSREAS